MSCKCQAVWTRSSSLILNPGIRLLRTWTSRLRQDNRDQLYIVNYVQSSEDLHRMTHSCVLAFLYRVFFRNATARLDEGIQQKIQAYISYQSFRPAYRRLHPLQLAIFLWHCIRIQTDQEVFKLYSCCIKQVTGKLIKQERPAYKQAYGEMQYGIKRRLFNNKWLSYNQL